MIKFGAFVIWGFAIPAMPVVQNRSRVAVQVASLNTGTLVLYCSVPKIPLHTSILLAHTISIVILMHNSLSHNALKSTERCHSRQLCRDSRCGAACSHPMGRRKQQHPQALLGPPESRQSVVELDVSSSPAPAASTEPSVRGERIPPSRGFTFASSLRQPAPDIIPLKYLLSIDKSDLTYLREDDADYEAVFSLDADPETVDVCWALRSVRRGDDRGLTVK